MKVLSFGRLQDHFQFSRQLVGGHGDLKAPVAIPIREHRILLEIYLRQLAGNALKTLLPSPADDETKQRGAQPSVAVVLNPPVRIKSQPSLHLRQPLDWVRGRVQYVQVGEKEGIPLFQAVDLAKAGIAIEHLRGPAYGIFEQWQLIVVAAVV